MKQEDKDLLLKDLCSRLPYEVKVQYEDNIFTIDYISAMYEEIKLNTPNRYTIDVLEVKPYLFPLSRMTKEQKEELENLGWYFDNFEIHNVSECLGTYREYVAHSDCFALIDWLNKKHFDYRCLIEKGLAIDATGLNIY